MKPHVIVFEGDTYGVGKSTAVHTLVDLVKEEGLIVGGFTFVPVYRRIQGDLTDYYAYPPEHEEFDKDPIPSRTHNDTNWVLWGYDVMSLRTKERLTLARRDRGGLDWKQLNMTSGRTNERPEFTSHTEFWANPEAMLWAMEMLQYDLMDEAVKFVVIDELSTLLAYGFPANKKKRTNRMTPFTECLEIIKTGSTPFVLTVIGSAGLKTNEAKDFRTILTENFRRPVHVLHHKLEKGRTQGPVGEFWRKELQPQLKTIKA